MALEVAQGLLNDSAHAGLVERLRQVRADADMVAKLEEIRLRLSEGRKSQESASLSPERMYADAFRTYGFPLLTLEPAEAAARVRNSAVREPLLAFLHDWFFWISDENRDQLQDVLDRADDDACRHAFRIALMKKDLDKLNALAHAPEAPDQPPVVLSGLASVMVADKYGNAVPARLLRTGSGVQCQLSRGQIRERSAWHFFARPSSATPETSGSTTCSTSSGTNAVRTRQSAIGTKAVRTRQSAISE